MRLLRQSRITTVLARLLGRRTPKPHAPFRRKLLFEGLESRLLLSADIGSAAVLSAPFDPVGEAALVASEASAGASAAGVIRVAIPESSEAAAVIAQLNDDTFFNFDAVAVSATELDTVEELNAYDAVVLGDYTVVSDLWIFAPALRAWVEGGGGVVGTGWLVFAAGAASGEPVGDIDAIIPVDTSGFYDYLGGATITVLDDQHPITQGISSFSTDALVEFAPGVDAGATVLGTADGQATIVMGTPGAGRGVYLGPTYFDSGSTSLRAGAADQLLEQAVAWAAGADAPEVLTADLVPVELNAPAAADFGTSITLSWTVRNQGSATASEPWYDRIVLSRDDQLSPDDYQLTALGAFAEPLTPGAEYTRTTSVSLPLQSDFDSGDYFLLLQTDAFAEQLEADESNNTLAVSIALTVPAPAELTVQAFRQTATGFHVQFNLAVDPAVLNLYSGIGALASPADVILVGAGSGAVNGSLVLDADHLGVTFIKTGGVLVADIYSVTVAGRAGGFVDTLGRVLDGDFDGVAGGDYEQAFEVVAGAVSLSVADVMRGPGQPVDIPATAASLPVRLSNGAGVNSVSFTISYDPTLFTIESITGPSGAVVWVDLHTAGLAIVELTGLMLDSGPVDVATIRATIPISAAYGATQVLDIGDVRVNGGAIAALDDDAVQVVGYLCDADGSRAYSQEDVTRIQRISLGGDTGFAAWPLIDPVIVADANRNGRVTGADSSILLREIAGFDRPEIPPIPLATLTQNWQGDFVNNLGQSEAERDPNSDIRIVLPA